MLLEARNLSKSIGTKSLFQEVTFSIVEGEKIALIGRNGYGKTTLLKILSGESHDYSGTVTFRKGISITLTKQEHIENTEQSAVDYILDSIPQYHRYKKILDEFEAGEHDNLDHYLQTLEIFTEKKFFNLPEAVLSTLDDYNIPNAAALGPLGRLSGGQKRYVEMARIMFSKADLLLVDEPTNHMDYKGKDRFIEWMRRLKETIIVVTHDRDVLKYVTKIIELKDQKLTVFKGNYDDYIAQNATQTLTSVKSYTDQLNRLKEAKKKVEWGLQMRAKSKEWKIRYDHWLRDYEKIKAATVKPAFWIDQNSVDEMDKKVVDSYQKFKERNIKISVKQEGARAGELIKVRNVALGYTEPLFEDLSFSLNGSERIFVKGTNGAGKSSLVRTVMALAENREPTATLLNGEIKLGADVRIGEYQQEIASKYLPLHLDEAIRQSYQEKQASIDEQTVRKLLAQYLFDPVADAKQRISELSGGQKARFQLITMFIGDPNLLILDEPTNHLDLPSIEELEKALERFIGGILYISHDTYFIEKMGGTVVEL